jgi:DNA-binding transcriptional LysR family regulator
MDDLVGHDVIGFDRGDAIIKAYGAHSHVVTREDFPVRCDDQMVYWYLLLAGAGVGFAQVLVTGPHPELEQVDIGMRLPPMPVWLVMHEEVRSNARICRVADHLAEALGGILGNA